MDKLTIQHLSAYLPYRLKVISNVNNHLYEVIGITKDEICIDDSTQGWFSYNLFKPVLRPMSYLTKEIEHNGEKFVPFDRLEKDFGVKLDEDGDLLIDYYNIGECDSPWTGFGIIQRLLSYHFDIWELISSGLAVDINQVKGDDNGI